MPTDDTIMNMIDPMFEDYKNRVKQLLWNSGSKITLCVDGWQSKTTLHYLGVTAHILIGNKIEVLALGFNECSQTDGASMFVEVKKVVEEYVIGHRIISICTDNGIEFFI